MKYSVMNILFCLFAMFLPSVVLRNIAFLFGFQMASKSRIGFSLVLASDLKMLEGARIGHLNIIYVKSLVIGQFAYVSHLNQIRRCMDVFLEPLAGIGNRNKIYRSKYCVKRRVSALKLGNLAKITSDHIIDCTSDIELGDYTTLAGIGTQIWTHGYYHYPNGPDRFRIDGSVNIGNNVYIGSACIINPGVKIANGISIGSGAVVSKSLDKPGLYVNQALRYVENDVSHVQSKLKKGDPALSCEIFYEKDIN